MDSLTQIVLGAAVGEAVLGKKVGNRAMLWGGIAGTIPDLDVLSSYFVDTVTALEIHRGFTHSILFALFFAPLFGYLVSKIDSYKSVKGWSILFFWGFFTHSLLDAHTTWGTQLLWPLDWSLSMRTVFVIDPLYTVPFIVFLILAMREKKDSKKRQFYNRMGLIVSSSYLLLTFGLKAVSYTQFKKALATQQIEYEELQTKPSALNAILWTASVKREDDILIGSYSFFDKSDIQFISYPKNHHLLGELIHHEKVQRMIHISKDWFTILEEGGELFFNDLRYGLFTIDKPSDDFVFKYKIVVNSDGSLTFVEAEKKIEDGKQLMKDLWTRLKGI